MITPKTLLGCNLSAKTVTAGGSAWTPPVFTWGEKVTLALRLTEERDGEEVETALTVPGLIAAMGPVDARAQSGRWALQMGAGAQTTSNTTEPLPHDVSPKDLEEAINALTSVTTTYGQATVRKSDGSWRITFATAATAVPLAIRDNTLFPVAINVGGAVEIDGAWVHELRFVQVPCVFSDTAERVLPEQPRIARVRGGASGDGYEYNEIQSLYVPPDFRGAYELRLGLIRTGELRVENTPEDVQAALEAVLDRGSVKVTPGNDFTVNIEFVGKDYKGTAVALLQVAALAPPPGDLTFTLDFGKAELLSQLRRAETVTFPLEVKVQVQDADEVLRWRVAFVTAITVRRPVHWPQMALVPNTDWLRVPSPIDYIPRSSATVFTGEKSAAYPVGDGSTTVFVLAHPFGTDDVRVWARENASMGRQLVDGFDFEARIVDADSVQVTVLGDAPDTDAWTIYVRTVAPIAAFADGLEITQAQVIDLVDRLDALEATIAAIQALLPSAPAARVDDEARALEIAIPRSRGVFPGRLPVGFSVDSVKPDGTGLPKARTFLLGALHDSTATNFTTTLPGSPSVGVYMNNGAALVTVPGFGGIRTATIAQNEFVGWDGRVWYRLTRDTTPSGTTSYFPRDYERELFRLAVNPKMLRAGQTLELRGKLTAALFQSETIGQAVVVIETGVVAAETSPATTGENIKAITWNATPLLVLQLNLGPVATITEIGAQIIRDEAGVFTANQLLYGQWEAAGSVPAGDRFIVRARIVQVDIEDAMQTTAKGFLFYDLNEAKAGVS